MALFSKQFANMAGNAIRNVGKPVKGTDALTWALPSYTTTERDAIDAIDGMIILNTTLNKIQAYVSGSWTSLH